MKRLEIVVLSLCAVLQGACAAEGTPPVQLPDAPAAAAAPAQVVAPTVTSSAVRQPVRGSGSAVAARMANLGAPVTARVERVHISAGDQVEAGQLLIELDDRQARLRAQQADAAASAAKLQADQLEADYARLAPLAARGSIAASRAEQLRAQADVAAASARVMATAARSAARAVTEAEFRAPFAATVLAVPV